PNCLAAWRGRHSVQRMVGPSHGREVRGRSSAPEAHATHPPSRPVQDFQCSERKELAEAPHTTSVILANPPPARESTYCRRVGKCVAPPIAPARTAGTPCVSDKRRASPAPGQDEQQ